MKHVKSTDLSAIPFLDAGNINGRLIISLAFYVKGDWNMWMSTNKGIQKIIAWPSEGFYFGDTPESKSDICLHFLDFLAQRAPNTSIGNPLRGLHDDFLNLSASLAKLDLLYKKQDEIKEGVTRMVSTEIEYIFSVCRSIFDLLQEIIARLWGTVKLNDTNVKKQSLPETFSKATAQLQNDNKPDSLIKKYGLPSPLAEFYTRNYPFFSSLRKFRDNVAHRGSSVGLIFSTEDGFAVQDTQAPFSEYGVWTEEHKKENGLCSLRPAIGYVIHQTLTACDDFSRTVENIIMFPPPIAPGLHLYMRGYFNEHLISNVDAINNSQWWSA